MLSVLIVSPVDTAATDLGAHFAQFTNNILNMIGQLPIGPPGEPPEGDGANPVGVDDVVNPPFPLPAAGTAPVNQGVAVTNVGEPVAPGGAVPAPLHFTTTFMGVVDPTTGTAMSDEDIPQPRVDDPVVEEICEKGRRGVKAKELEVLERWKMGGFAPQLKTVSFDMVSPCYLTIAT